MPHTSVGRVPIGLTEEPAAHTLTDSSLQRQQQGDPGKVLKSFTREAALLVIRVISHSHVVWDLQELLF